MCSSIILFPLHIQDIRIYSLLFSLFHLVFSYTAFIFYFSPCKLVQTERLQFSGAYSLSGVDNSLRLTDFFKDFRVEIISFNSDDIEFDMIGIDAAIVNAFRRILISEVYWFIVFVQFEIIQGSYHIRDFLTKFNCIHFI